MAKRKTPSPFDLLPAFDLEPEKAIAYLRKKGVEVSGSWDEMSAAAHQRAFTVAGVASADLLMDMLDSLDRAQTEGKDFGEWRKEVELLLERRGWTGATPWRLETIYRTNIQSSYQAGRLAEQIAAKDARPYWQYIAVGDKRTRPSHAAMDGEVRRADDVFWSKGYPPNGYLCRCRAVSLSERQVKDRGLTVAKGKSKFVPDKGFDSAPGEWEPDLSRYPRKLAARVREKVKG